MSNQEKQILIIEDDLVLANTIHDILNLVGYEAHIINDGREALNYLNRNIPSVILLDMQLPSVSGQDILLYIQSESRFQKTELIVMTANTQLHHAASKLTTALLKPISATTLIENVKTALSA